jgi:hypothetical protein
VDWKNYFEETSPVFQAEDEFSFANLRNGYKTIASGPQ